MVSSRSCLGLETKDTRLSVLSRSHSTFDYQKVLVSDSSICNFFKESCSQSHRKILVSSLPESDLQLPPKLDFNEGCAINIQNKNQYMIVYVSQHLKLRYN